jgi:hypothetical protein
MIFKRLLMEAAMVTLSFLVIGCAISEQNATKTAPIGFITTPASYYSSAKARYLGTKYKENLDRLAERIVRNPKTASLQFANNIASVGGIGFFTHSATNTADERFLEVIVSAPETFESKGDLNTKVLNVVSAYGTELLSILAADPDIYQEKEVSGYGLNLTWRSLVPDPKGTRVALERAVIYVAKDKVRGFLHQEVDPNKLLADAIIFTAADNGPMNLVSYRQQEPRLDTRLPIQEESLVVPQIETRAESHPPPEPRRETVKETLTPSPAAGDTQSTGIAPGGPIAPVKQRSLQAKRQEQIAVSKPTETVKEDSSAARQSRDGSRDRPPEATKRSDHEAMVKHPVAEPPSVPSRTPAASAVKSETPTHITEKSSVTKRLDEPSEFTKAESKANTSQIQKVDHDREAKSASDVRKSDSSTPAPEKTARGGEIAKAAAANAARSQGGIVENMASGTSTSALKTADDKRTAVLPKSTSGAHASPITDAQPKVQKKVAPLAAEQLSVSGKSSLAGGPEPQRRAGTVLPAQRNQLEIAKATPDPLAKSIARGDSQRGAIPDSTSVSADASKSAPVKNRDVALAAKSEVKTPAVRAVSITQSPERSSPSTSDKAADERIALQKNKASEIVPKAKAGGGAQSKALEGYIIQLAFKDRGDAQRWAETMERRGYAVSVTEAGGMESVRVRVGNFLVREEADRQLTSLKQEGLTGIVINLPQAYRPDTRTVSSEKSETQSAQPRR